MREPQNTKNQSATFGSTTDTRDKPIDENTDEPADSSAQGDDKQENLGPAPKSLDVIAKENGGDAGNLKAESESTSAKDGGGDASAKVDDDNSDESKGTGEQYVKTTGLAADGGDFDATKPGAGREADRK